MAKHALVVGINDYTIQSQHSQQVGLSWPTLNFCVADADSMYHLLIEAFGFPRENVILLKDDRATRRNMLSALTYMFSNATAGDTVCFTFSGHGGLLPANTAEDNTRFYQSIIPYQGDWIYDFRLHQAAHQAGFDPNEINFTCFIDSCHSGGMHPSDTAEESIPRSVPFDENTANLLESIREMWPFGMCLPDDTNELFPNVSNPQIDDNQVLIDLEEDPNKTFVDSAQATLIAACKYYEVAREDPARGHGYLTKALIDLVNSSNFRISYNELIDELVTRVTSFSNGNQNPTLRGQQGRMDHPFLEGWTTSI
ncbi:caspase domain-containing protein [Fodinibius sp.]|uniref:caspase family protein n=1 Tax=Fodinibius sp. TaxID=1872440 RepID=UPI003565D5EA